MDLDLAGCVFYVVLLQVFRPNWVKFMDFASDLMEIFKIECLKDYFLNGFIALKTL